MNLEDYIKFDISMLIKDNIDVYMNNDSYFKKIKKYLNKHCVEDIKTPLPYELLAEFTEEVLIDLLRAPHLYDYSDKDLPY